MRLKTTTHAPTYGLRSNDLLMGEYVNQYILKVKDLPSDQKPREKLSRLGPKSLSVSELMAVLLGVGTKKEEVMAMAQRIVKEYGEKSIAHEADPAKIAEALDIPLSKACQIVASFELGRRFFSTKSGKPKYVRNGKQAYRYLKEMGKSKKEQLRGIYLNSRYEVVHDEVISVGSLTANIVHPREVYQPAIEYGAVAVIIAHNHPSGSLDPTDADIEVTEQLLVAGRYLGIDLLDHLIITEDKFTRIQTVFQHDYDN